MSKKIIRVFETFAGIGSQHKALEILKREIGLEYEVVATSEWDIWANISYNAIHHNNDTTPAKNMTREDLIEKLGNWTHSNDSKKEVSVNFFQRQSFEMLQYLYSAMINANNLGSISEIDGYQLVNKTQERGGVDLITYSFPCQDLSVAGSFHGFNQGMKRGSGTRSGLLWEIARILIDLNKVNKLPKYLLLENVKNMLSEKHKNDYMEWLTFLKELGYNTKTFLLNAENYGIPQHRERVYALSVRGESDFLDTLENSNGAKIIDEQNPKNISVEMKISRKMNDILEYKINSEKKAMELKGFLMKNTPSRVKMANENYLLYGQSKYEEKSKQFIKKKPNAFYENDAGIFAQKTRTLTTKQDRHPNAGIVSVKKTFLDNIDGNKYLSYRFISNKEAYLLMGFHIDDFKNISKSCVGERKEIMYRQAGNSIVVNVLVALFNYVLNKKWKK